MRPELPARVQVCDKLSNAQKSKHAGLRAERAERFLVSTQATARKAVQAEAKATLPFDTGGYSSCSQQSLKLARELKQQQASVRNTHSHEQKHLSPPGIMKKPQDRSLTIISIVTKARKLPRVKREGNFFQKAEASMLKPTLAYTCCCLDHNVAALCDETKTTSSKHKDRS